MKLKSSTLKKQLSQKVDSIKNISVKKIEIIENIFSNFKGQIRENINDFREGSAGVNINMLIQSVQDKIEKTLRSDENNVVLKQSRYWASSITWCLIGGTIFGVTWVSIAKTDEIVIAQGKLEPKGGVINVQMPLEGITKEILIKEGEQVKKNQVLIRLDTDITKAENQFLQDQLELNKNIEKRLFNLVEEGAVSELQYLEQIAKGKGIERRIKTNLVQLKYQEIKSPEDGLVFNLVPKGPGYVARTSQPVLQIVPLTELIAKIEIENRTIGFVKPGKKVEINVDSFPASDFGTIEGTITRIGSDALPPDPRQGKGYRFPADISLKTQYLPIKTGNKLKLQAGMSLQANIKLRKVTYLQLLFKKFNTKIDSLRSI